ncbi:MAG: DUF4435 domain-containing protein [Chloroflexi bacterium]|nr:DUF4435 domain-containing protein [Chloroflexota bacterium]
MTQLLDRWKIYVEGPDDETILSHWFPELKFVKAGGKDEVHKKVANDPNSFGLIDRDFADDNMVEASRIPNSRLLILRRYTIENYLLEPAIIAEALQAIKSSPESDVVQRWLNQVHYQREVVRWAGELSLYAAANSIVSEWRNSIQYDRQLSFLSYFGSPPVSRVEILRSLHERLSALTPIHQVENELDRRYERMFADTENWNDLHKWISGKVLLENYCFHQIPGFMNLGQKRLRDLLIESGVKHIPAELQELAEWWSKKVV